MPDMTEHLKRFCVYNRDMNQKVYAAAAALPQSELMQDRGAFFGSIFGTLNHLVVADRIWLGRFAGDPRFAALAEVVTAIPAPDSLTRQMAATLPELLALRQQLDDELARLADLLTDAHLDSQLAYRNIQGVPMRKPVFAVLSHMFNHQTHHRGQISTLLFQAGQDIGVTDLIAWVQDIEA